MYGLLGRGRLQVGASAAQAPVTAAFLVWSGRILAARRVPWRALLPFGLVGGILTAVYSVGATVYLPHLFSSSATRYGAVGAVFATLSALFGVMLVTVGSAVLGREVRDELVRIRRGERQPEDEIRREWDSVIDQARSRWDTTRRADPPPPTQGAGQALSRDHLHPHRRPGPARADAEEWTGGGARPRSQGPDPYSPVAQGERCPTLLSWIDGSTRTRAHPRPRFGHCTVRAPSAIPGPMAASR